MFRGKCELCVWVCSEERCVRGFFVYDDIFIGIFDEKRKTTFFVRDIRIDEIFVTFSGKDAEMVCIIAQIIIIM